MREIGEGRYEVISPRLMRAGGELAQLGVSPQVALDVVEDVRRHAQGVSRTFIDLFVREVWEPFEARRAPRGGLAQGRGRARAAAPPRL